jgi:hypothetical protein
MALIGKSELRKLDQILKMVERECDKQSVILEEVDDYIFVCKILTNIDLDEEVSWENQADVIIIVEDLCGWMNLNYHQLIKEL